MGEKAAHQKINQELYKVDYSKYKYIKVEKQERVALVKLNRPPHNFINVEMHKEFAAIPRDLRQDLEVRAIVLAAEGENFCGGGDRELFEFLQEEPTADYVHFEECRDITWNWLELEKPTIAAVHGLAVGQACNTALSCDMCFAADDDKTRFSDGHMFIANAPGDGGVLIWPLLVGIRKAKQYLYTSDFVYAREAERIGLINAAVPREKLLPTAMEWANRFANGPLLALRWAKAALQQYIRLYAVTCYNYSWALQMASRRMPDAVEARTAMKEKRKPKFY